MDAAVYDRTYDILISYRKTNAEFVEALVQRLNDYDVRCFYDSKAQTNGWMWKNFWAAALRRKPNKKLDPVSGPGVIVIATEAMLEEKDEDHVVREIREAFDQTINGQHEIPITLLCFSRDGTEELQRRIGLDYDLGERHYPRMFDGVAIKDPDTISEDTWCEICRAAIHVSRGTTTRRLQKLREEARAWAKSVLMTIWSTEDFSTNTDSASSIRNALNQSIANREISRLAIVGPGGFGKTKQLARTLVYLLDENPNLFFPVIVNPQDLKDGAGMLRKKLGLGSDPWNEPLSLVEGAYAWAQGHIFFIIDSLERFDQVKAAANELRVLNTSATICITSRPETWGAVEDILAFKDEEIVRTCEINSETAAKLLGIEYGEFARQRSYLRQPVFLDMAIHLLRTDDLNKNIKAIAVESKTALLDALTRWACDQDGGSVDAQHEINTRNELLRGIAKIQVEQSRFDIARSKLLEVDSSLAKERDKALEYLTAIRPLIIEFKNADGEIRLRLRHDIVDSHNISRLLLDRPGLRKEMLKTFDNSFDQIVYEGVVQIAHDIGRSDIIDEFFACFLRAIDNKHNKKYQASAWNTGYVITAKIPLFLDRLKKTFCGDFLLDELPSVPGEAVSSLDPPRLTEAALSSVASMFLGAKPVSILDSDGALLRALDKYAKKARYRGRILEAVAKLDDGRDGAINILERFGHDREALSNDRPVAIYIANGLAGIARFKPCLCKRAIDAVTAMIELLESEINEVDLPILRILYHRRNEIRKIDNQSSLPEFDEKEPEFLQGLRLYERCDISRLSDWAIFEYYCLRIRANRAVFNGEVSQLVVQALGRGFWHDQVRCHEYAASALGAVDHPFSRGILLHILAFETNDRTVTAVIGALTEQVLRLKNREREQLAFLRAFKRAAAERHRRMDAINYRADLIRKLYSVFDRSDSALVTEGCIEIISLEPTVQFCTAPPGQFEESQWSWLTDEETSADVGPELEQKLSILGASTWAVAANELQCAPASWKVPARAHRAVTARMKDIERKSRKEISTNEGEKGLMHYDTLVERHIEAAAHLYTVWEEGFRLAFFQPSIAVVHVIVTTQSKQLLKARRSLSAFSYPGAWAATFEEQIRRSDLESLPVLDSVVKRGIREEFQVELEPTDLKIVSACLIMEWPILNPGILIHAHIHGDGKEFLRTDLTIQENPEIIDRVLMPLEDIKSRMKHSSVGFHFLETTDKEHPTSVARMVLAIAAQQD